MTQEDVFSILQEGDAEKMKVLLDASPEKAGSKDANGVSLVLTALYHRKPDMAALIAGHLPALSVHEASALGDESALKHALEADPDCLNRFADDGFTPLHLAGFFGREQAVGVLLDAGADLAPHSKNPMQVAAINCATAGRNERCVKLILEAGADVNTPQQKGYTPLMSAASAGSESMVNLLLQAGADTSLVSEDGKTARILAEEHGHKHLLDLL